MPGQDSRPAAGGNQTVLYRLDDFPDLEVFEAKRSTHTYSRHIHSFFSLSATLAGTRLDWHRGTKYHQTPGCIVVVSPGEVHGGGAADASGYSSRAVRLSDTYFASLLTQISGQARAEAVFVPPVIYAPQSVDMVLRLHSVLSSSAPKLEKEYALYSVLARIIGCHAAEKPALARLGRERGPAQRVRRYLQDRLDRNVSLDELARAAALSPFHLARAFTAEVGVPPHIYHLQVRLARAADLLAAGMPVAAVAAETGFCDQSHLTRAFRSRYGVTPGNFTGK